MGNLKCGTRRRSCKLYRAVDWVKENNVKRLYQSKQNTEQKESEETTGVEIRNTMKNEMYFYGCIWELPCLSSSTLVGHHINIIKIRHLFLRDAEKSKFKVDSLSD